MSATLAAGDRVRITRTVYRADGVRDTSIDRRGLNWRQYGTVCKIGETFGCFMLDDGQHTALSVGRDVFPDGGCMVTTLERVSQ
jgi:hypothetical protein